MEEAEYCDKILIQDAGKKLAMGSPEEIRAGIDGDSAMSMEETFISILAQSRQKRDGEAADVY